MVDTQHVILIIEDDHDTLDFLVLFFSAEGYLVRVANTRETALSILQKFEAPDLILSDLNMPGMTLDEFVTEVRRLDPQLDILLMSSLKDLVYDKARALGLDFIHKPPNLTDLQRRVRSSIQKRREMRG
jgi:DNA-binding response OmpR family regulator